MKISVLIGISLSIFSIVSCKDSASLAPGEVKAVKSSSYESIFLDLNPAMDTATFNKRVKENPAIQNGNFILPVGVNNLDFKISQHDDRISLNHSTIIELSESRLNRKKSQEIIDKNEKTISEFISLFDKYEQYFKNDLPFVKNKQNQYLDEQKSSMLRESVLDVYKPTLSNYGFYEDRYQIFQDSIKTIAIGFSVEGKIVLSADELEQKIDTRKGVKRNNSAIDFDLTYDEALLESRKQNVFSSERFGIKLEVNYFINSDFEALVQKMILDEQKFMRAKVKADSIEKLRQNIIEDNRDKI